MIECQPNDDLGRMAIDATMPNGLMEVTRRVVGQEPWPLRHGVQEITTGGALIEDTEAPVGVPVTYRMLSTPLDRTIQKNLVLTPTLLHGVQTWLAGTGRTLTTPADATAHSAAAVARVTGNATSSLAVPPTMIGHVDSTPYVSGAYTLTATTTGGTAIATNDWMFLVHNQLNTVADPTVAGWELIKSTEVGTQISMTIWRKKYTSGSPAAVVTALAGSSAMGSLFWVRGAGDLTPEFGPVITVNTTPLVTSLTVGPVESINPALVFTIGALETITAGTLTGTGGVAGPSWRFTLGTSPNTRSTIVANESDTNAGLSKQATLTVPTIALYFSGVQMAVWNATPVTNRVVARVKVAPAAAADGPYRFTGRLKYLTSDVWLWQDVKNQGTWANLKATKATWALVKSSTTLAVDEAYAKMFAVLVNPADGTFYTTPVPVISVVSNSSNQWVDFNFYSPLKTDVPAGSELWFVHGSTLREYLITWYFDEISMIKRLYWAEREPLYYMDGDTPVPVNPEDMIMADSQDWTAVGDDAAIAWDGTPGNSTSTFLGPTQLYQETSCELGLPYITTCTPVLLSDPVKSSAALWLGLLSIDSLKHPSNTEVYQILSRSDAVAVGQVGNWETGTISFLSRTFDERFAMVDLIRSGRVKLIRIGDDGYPEDNWYLALGDFSETRLSDDHADPTRTWSATFVHVQRPVGYIESSAGSMWSDVKALGTWADVRTDRSTWLDVLTTEPAGAEIVA